MADASAITTFLFTDIEGSTRLWEREPSRMHDALARHDALAAQTVAAHHGRIVKTTGDGIHAVFGDPLDAVQAAIALQLALIDPAATAGVPLAIRCGLHAGADNRRDNDFYGIAVNRAARLMSCAHGGQVLLSEAVTALIRDRVPSPVELIALGSVRLRDLAQPENVFQAAHPALRRDFPALRSLEATPNNLPQQLTSFIGREHELAEVRRQLQDARLLTIFGIGGLGKSRLSLHVATDVLADYPDGVWFVELAPIIDERLVPQAIASVLGVKEEAGEPVAAAVAKFARDRRMLLVLDNCEHLTQACAQIARKILEAASKVAILATSRERLGIAGEKTYPLAPFAVPLPRQQLTPGALAQFASVRLFAERATAARPDFAVTADNALAVAEICHRLDGIPLALELAAARVRALSVQKIAERLIDRFRLLSGGDRTALPRQQTLRALIDWSYDLLDPREQTLFARLSVFAGGFTLEAAESVGAGGEIGEHDVVDLLTGLVDKSLVSHPTDSTRYWMLETVRQYGQERLEALSESDAVRSRHLVFYLTQCENLHRQVLGNAPAHALRTLDQERENVLLAHAWCDRIDDGGPLGLRLVRAIRSYCFVRGLLGLGLGITLQALARPTAQARDFLRCRALSDAGQLVMRMGRHDEALHYLEESLAIAREIGDDARIAIVLQPIGLTYLELGDPATARTYLVEALDRANSQQNGHEIAAAMSAVAQLHRSEGDLHAAETMSRSAVTVARDSGLKEPTGVGLLNLAMIAILRGDAAAARAMLEEILAINREMAGGVLSQGALDVGTGLAAMNGEFAQAARFYGAAQAGAAHMGLHRDRADEAFVSQLVDKMQNALGGAAFAAAVGEGHALDNDAAIARLTAWLAGV